MTFADECLDVELESGGGGAQGKGGGGDPFTRQLLALDIGSGRKKVYQPIVCTLDMLKALKREEVFIIRSASGLPIPNVYYRNMVPDVAVVLCPSCQKPFHQEDYEFECLKTGGCPFCKAKRASV